MSENPFPNLHLVDHPLVQHKLSHLRDRTTWTPLFRALLREIALLIGYEITRGLPMDSRTIETPLTEMEAPFLRGHKPAIVPILRAGLGMAEGLAELLPTAPLGHIGLYRDPETHR
ncbi:MAG: uracil phosphoribosyltransferase, partial [Gemmatimonadota bacterium]|nr:uracil phosphoribosyltransferase [Gemmatimonadota bacterium]